jgi:hypothetical protein
MSKQTAVNFLIKEFSDILGPLETKPMQDLLLMDAMKKAKEMEKEQIIDAHKASAMFEMDADRYAEQYYNEQYGK